MRSGPAGQETPSQAKYSAAFFYDQPSTCKARQPIHARAMRKGHAEAAETFSVLPRPGLAARGLQRAA